MRGRGGGLLRPNPEAGGRAGDGGRPGSKSCDMRGFAPEQQKRLAASLARVLDLYRPLTDAFVIVSHAPRPAHWPRPPSGPVGSAERPSRFLSPPLAGVLRGGPLGSPPPRLADGAGPALPAGGGGAAAAEGTPRRARPSPPGVAALAAGFPRHRARPGFPPPASRRRHRPRAPAAAPLPQAPAAQEAARGPAAGAGAGRGGRGSRGSRASPDPDPDLSLPPAGGAAAERAHRVSPGG